MTKKKKTDFYLLKKKSISEGDLFVTDYIKTRKRLDRVSEDLETLKCPNEYLSNSQVHSWWQYMVVLSNNVNRTGLASKLLERNIPTANAYWPACHEQPVLKQYAIKEYPVADDILNRHLALFNFLKISNNFKLELIFLNMKFDGLSIDLST